MSRHQTGTKNGQWKGGRVVASNGYVLIRVGVDHHLADVRGYAYEHRIVAEQVVGRRLRRGEVVHHKNGCKLDNRHENIEVCHSHAHHRVAHRIYRSGRRLPGEENRSVSCSCGCGGKFMKFDVSGRPRRFISGHNGASKCRL